MPDIITKTRNDALANWNKFDGKRKRRIILIGTLLAIALSVAGVSINTIRYSTLYTDLNIDETGEILSSLNETGIKAKIVNGSTIMVDSAKEDEARMQLAMKGYPKSGLSYDLYMNSINFTTSSKDKNIMLNYQLQDRLSSTISNLQGIKGAIVTISIEDEDVFNFDAEESPISASVVLELDGGFSPSSNHISAIKRLMVTSVSGLKEANIAVIDSDMNDLLPSSSGDIGSSAKNVVSFEQKVENEIAEKVLFIFEPVFGAENIKVSVNATVDLDIKHTEIIEYSPVVEDQGIPFIIDELSENAEDSTQNSNGVSSSYNVESDSLNERVSKVINYRVNEFKQTIEEAPGGVEDITVSILLNGENLDAGMLANVRQLASAAVGIDESMIIVGNMVFTADEERKSSIVTALSENQGFELPISEKAIIAIIAMFFVFIIAIMLMRQFKKPSKSRSKNIVEPVKIEIGDGSQIKALPDSLNGIAKIDSSDNEKHDALNKKNSILNKFKEDNSEKEIIKGLESIIETNPANIAEVISIWLNEDGEAI